MSQRECAGFNWPPLAICACEPVSSAPEAVSRAGPGDHALACICKSVKLTPIVEPRAMDLRLRSKNASGSPFACCAVGVAHPASATVLRLLSLFPAALLPFCAGVPAIGVGQPANVATCGNATETLRPSGIFPVALIPSHDCEPIAFPTVGVGQPAIAAAMHKSCGVPLRAISEAAPSAVRIFFSPSAARGVGHPVRSVSDMRRADARSRERDTPEGVTHAFHVSVYKVEPVVRSLACNLLSKDDWRAALRDEVLPGGP